MVQFGEMWQYGFIEAYNILRTAAFPVFLFNSLVTASPFPAVKASYCTVPLILYSYISQFYRLCCFRSLLLYCPDPCTVPALGLTRVHLIYFSGNLVEHCCEDLSAPVRRVADVEWCSGSLLLSPEVLVGAPSLQRLAMETSGWCRGSSGAVLSVGGSSFLLLTSWDL